MVVDDTPDFLALVAMLLENEDYKVFMRSTGGGTFEQIKRRQPDLVILDLMLPDVDGWDILVQLKADQATRQIPVIICSAAIDRVRSQRTKLAAMNVGILEKPFELDELLGKVERAIGKADSPRSHEPHRSASGR